jgi:hypothetical protein
MVKGNRYLYAINKQREQMQEEEKDSVNVEHEFNIKLNKGMTKYNWLRHWGVEVLNTNEEKLDRETELQHKNNTEVFNRRRMVMARHDGGTMLAKDENAKNYLEKRKAEIRTQQLQRYALESTFREEEERRRRKRHRDDKDDRRRDHDRHHRDRHQRDRHDRDRHDRDRHDRDRHDRDRHDKDIHDDRRDKHERDRNSDRSREDKELFHETFIKVEDKHRDKIKIQLESHDLNNIRIEPLPESEKDKKRHKKAMQVDTDEYNLKQPKKKMTKREEKLYMEQIKEDLKAKKNPKYKPRDIFAEDAERRRQEEALKKMKKLQEEGKSLEDNQDVPIKRKKVIEDSDGEDAKPSKFNFITVVSKSGGISIPIPSEAPKELIVKRSKIISDDESPKGIYF